MPKLPTPLPPDLAKHDGKSFEALAIAMPTEELVERVATLMAHGLYQARLPWLPGEKIKVEDLKGPAVFVIGGLTGMEKKFAREN